MIFAQSQIKERSILASCVDTCKQDEHSDRSGRPAHWSKFDIGHGNGGLRELEFMVTTSRAATLIVQGELLGNRQAVESVGSITNDLHGVRASSRI